MRTLTSLGLKEAKELVEAAPKAVLEKVTKEAAGKATRLALWFVDIPPVTVALRLRLSFDDGLVIDANVAVRSG